MKFTALILLLMTAIFAEERSDWPVVKGINVSMAHARQVTGINFPDQFVVSASNLNLQYRQIRVTVRYIDSNGRGEFIANATIGDDRTALMPMPITDASTFIATDIWIDYGNTTKGFDYPQQ